MEQELWWRDMLRKIVSGGQTGADRAGLDFAIDRGIPHGGWCPQGRWAEDGRIEPKYHLLETHRAIQHNAPNGMCVILKAP